MTERPDFSGVYESLKDFQRATVTHVADHFFGPQPARRYLVADEVGLGKTLVATGVVARTVEYHLDRGTERIDVIYICSNGDIARQNTARLVARLQLPEVTDTRPIERITLLPRAIHHLKKRRINFVSLTPGTSFQLKSSEGRAEERMLLYSLLRGLWGTPAVRGNPAMRVFAGRAGLERFRRHALWLHHHQPIDQDLADDFRLALEQADEEARRYGLWTFRERFEDVRSRFLRPRRSRPPEDRDARRQFIGDLRGLLARRCIEALEPDLVILDEFQRFKHLFDDTDPAGELAHVLFGFQDVKVLLLSATPYKMFTLTDEVDEDHYEDLVRTLCFLAGDQYADGLRALLRAYRRGLFTLQQGDGKSLLGLKDQIEQMLRRVMVRTERLASSPDRNGMLEERPVRQMALTPGDLHQYVGLERVSDLVDGGPVLDFWKSTPYPLNFMEHYKLDRALARSMEAGDVEQALTRCFSQYSLLFPWDDVTAYQRVDPANGRMRALLADTVEREAWRLLWLTPSLPYYKLGKPFNDPDLACLTKRLVFSAWRVVPKVVATLLSYEAERRMSTSGKDARARQASERRQRFRPLLRFQRAHGRLSGMPVFALMYPSPTLARLGDPRAVAGELGAAGGPIPRELVLGEVRRRLEEVLGPLIAGAPSEGPIDDAWYWAAPILLDRQADGHGWNTDWWVQPDLAGRMRSMHDAAAEDASAGWEEHVTEARRLVTGQEPPPSGRPPDDLLDVIARMAVASPGVTALRALTRITAHPAGPFGLLARNSAAQVAWGFRSLFNLPEVTMFLRGRAPRRDRREDAYWRLVLGYCVDGCLQAVLDEYAHVLPESLGATGQPPEVLLEEVATTVREALMLRTAAYGVQELEAGNGRIQAHRQSMRGRFALRFGDERSEDRQSLQRQSQVRTAFNSPFAPFVLVTTSVGQEGLDFHQYCHAVVHWNLPANPVDLEQREGRVHRYKGHAIRKNVATKHRSAAFGEQADPWEAMFAAASADRGSSDSDLVPYWVYPVEDGARIERYVPALPLSRDSQRLEDLRRSLAAYRLAFGQPRQEDLVAFLRERFTAQQIEQLLNDLRIDLTPRDRT